MHLDELLERLVVLPGNDSRNCARHRDDAPGPTGHRHAAGSAPSGAHRAGHGGAAERAGRRLAPRRPGAPPRACRRRPHDGRRGPLRPGGGRQSRIWPRHAAVAPGASPRARAALPLAADRLCPTERHVRPGQRRRGRHAVLDQPDHASDRRTGMGRHRRPPHRYQPGWANGVGRAGRDRDDDRGGELLRPTAHARSSPAASGRPRARPGVLAGRPHGVGHLGDRPVCVGAERGNRPGGRARAGRRGPAAHRLLQRERLHHQRWSVQ